LAYLTIKQGLCQARTTCRGMGTDVQDRDRGHRTERRGTGVSCVSLPWCQDSDASGLTTCQHVGTSSGGQGRPSSRARASDPELAHPELPGGPFHAQAHRRAVRAAQYLPRLPEYGQGDVWRGTRRHRARVTCKTGPGERITARLMMFCSSRILPGQAYRPNPYMVSERMVSIVLCMRRANCCTHMCSHAAS
jgi:hypothetical protein